ncbi:MAG: circularly permuted type 2 ATP-grasp protein [Pseudomonadales bacterium]|nr:circularly permuted type 2 ATP-grasp protein [Pseudomonadales bacterium]MCP5185659.1 circularly permuted type 2 ATP-grasp protein [Pseudomonadales bacterium]
MPTNWSAYDGHPHFDECLQSSGQARPVAAPLLEYLRELSERGLKSRQAAANRAIMEMGITFTVYAEGENIDRAWPLDIIPRVIANSEWSRIEKGLEQRLRALNLFIDDVYHAQNALKDRIVPRELIESSRDFLPQAMGARPAHGVWANVCGTDLVRDRDGTVYVLEDNLRVPSGVSYMLENRSVTKRVFPTLFRHMAIRPVDAYPSQLFDMLASLSPRPGDDPEIVVLTPGIYNSAYFEHSFLAQRMGTELVAGSDLVVLDDDCVYMRTIEGLARVDTIYRRINDGFLDPKVFDPHSVLGTPGLFGAWYRGNVAISNAPGSGVADDKVVYSYVPDLIRYYLAEEPILPNVPTWRCEDRDSLRYVEEHLAELVVKPANESGGYGMLVGPHASVQEVETMRQQVRANPRNYIAQPTLSLSTVPTVCGSAIEPRHVDLRPFILQGAKMAVTAGGLTRVALRKGSLVVNSSQGGGSKDTWVVEDV